MNSVKLFSTVIFLIAFVVAILGIALPIDHISAIVVIMRFFDYMLPILAVGALVKFLCCCPRGKDSF